VAIEIFGISATALMGQLTIGLVNGSFYAMVSLGLAIIFGLMGIVNFAHGALYMMGAMSAWMLLNYAGIGYWWALLLGPMAVAVFGVVVERTLIQRVYDIDHVYGMLLTFGLTLVITSVFRYFYGVSGMPYDTPEAFEGAFDLGFMMLPRYRGFVIVLSVAVCFATWFVIERTRLGGYLRAATENPKMTQALGINVPLIVTLTYAFGVALAALAGVLAGPVTQVSPLMGDSILIVAFAIVVIGGFGSIAGTIVTGLSLGVIEGLMKVFYAPGSAVIVFFIMLIVLAVRPAGLFGRKS
jgi:branched-chain amino acid transport system permease protein